MPNLLLANLDGSLLRVQSCAAYLRSNNWITDGVAIEDDRGRYSLEVQTDFPDVVVAEAVKMGFVRVNDAT